MGLLVVVLILGTPILILYIIDKINKYKKKEKEKLKPKTIEKNQIEAFIARDADGTLTLFQDEPICTNGVYVTNSPNSIELPKEMFPNLNFKTGAIKVTIEIKCP